MTALEKEAQCTRPEGSCGQRTNRAQHWARSRMRRCYGPYAAFEALGLSWTTVLGRCSTFNQDYETSGTLTTATSYVTYLQAFDTANADIGSEQYPQKTEVICHVADVGAAPPERSINDVRPLASVTTAARESIALGVPVGPRQYVADQLLANADVIWAMHERAQLCQDPHSEFALLRESLGVSRMNHVLRVHGCTILQEKEAARIFEVGQRSSERLLPGFAGDGLEQVPLSASQSGIGYKRARDVASAAHLGAPIAAQTAIWT